MFKFPLTRDARAGDARHGALNGNLNGNRNGHFKSSHDRNVPLLSSSPARQGTLGGTSYPKWKDHAISTSSTVWPDATTQRRSE
jgi:hypothetical protein